MNMSGPRQCDVDALRAILDALADFTDNDQRARYILSSNWLRDHGAAAATHAAIGLALLQARP